MDIDKIRDGQHILRALVDIDDRTEDGNQRTKMLAKTDPKADPLTFDAEPMDDDDYGLIGDGQIDMSDFRRFRDWNLLVMDEEGLIIATDSLDGSTTHPKHDPNRNRRPHNQDSYDRFYPRTDFNGDGMRYDPARRIPVDGVFNGAMLDDLQVLQELFVDTATNYRKADLPGLVASSDLHISLYWFMKWNVETANGFEIPQVRVRIRSRIARTERVYFIDVPEGDPDRGTHFLITLPAPDEHRVFVCGDAGGVVGELGEVGENALVDFDAKFGRDRWFAPRVLLDGEPCEPAKK